MEIFQTVPEDYRELPKHVAESNEFSNKYV